MGEECPELFGEDGGPEEGDPGGLGPAVPVPDAFEGGQHVEDGGEAGQGQQGVVAQQQHQKRGFAEGEGPAFISPALALAVVFAHQSFPRCRSVAGEMNWAIKFPCFGQKPRIEATH